MTLNHRSKRPGWPPGLAPRERRALALIAALFLLGAAVRWLRLSGAF